MRGVLTPVVTGLSGFIICTKKFWNAINEILWLSYLTLPTTKVGGFLAQAM